MSTKDSEDGSKPEANQVEHGAKVTALRPFALVLMLLISKTDGLVTRDNREKRAAQMLFQVIDSAIVQSFWLGTSRLL